MIKMQNGFILLTIMFLSACTMPETKMYTLYIPSGEETAGANVDASLAIYVDSGQYLKQPYIAYRNSLYQLAVSRYSRWESSPNKMVRNEFKNALSSKNIFKAVRADNMKVKGDYVLKIKLTRFERFDAENNDAIGTLDFDVSLFSPDGREEYHDTISKKVKLDDRSFVSLAKGLSSALHEGIEEVSMHVRDILGHVALHPEQVGTHIE